MYLDVDYTAIEMRCIVEALRARHATENKRLQRWKRAVRRHLLLCKTHDYYSRVAKRPRRHTPRRINGRLTPKTKN